MPLSSAALIAERHEKIMRLLALIAQNPGEKKSRVKGLFMLNPRTAVKKSCFYDYLEVLVDAGQVVEDQAVSRQNGYLYTTEAWTAEEKRRREDANYREELRVKQSGGTLEEFLTTKD